MEVQTGTSRNQYQSIMWPLAGQTYHVKHHHPLGSELHFCAMSDLIDGRVDSGRVLLWRLWLNWQNR